MLLLLWLCCEDPNTEYVQNQLYQNVYSLCVCDSVTGTCNVVIWSGKCHCGYSALNQTFRS